MQKRRKEDRILGRSEKRPVRESVPSRRPHLPVLRTRVSSVERLCSLKGLVDFTTWQTFSSRQDFMRRDYCSLFPRGLVSPRGSVHISNEKPSGSQGPGQQEGDATGRRPHAPFLREPSPCRRAPGRGQTCSPRRAASDKPQGSVALVKGVKEEPRRLAGMGCEISPSAPSRERSQWHRDPALASQLTPLWGVAHRGIGAGPTAVRPACPVRAMQRPAGPRPPRLARGPQEAVSHPLAMAQRQLDLVSPQGANVGGPHSHSRWF